MNNTIKFKIFDIGYSPLEEGFSLEPQVLVFRDEQAWSHFWQSSSFIDIDSQKLPAPEVDFERHMVIALTPGSRPTGGYGVRVDHITQRRNSQQNQWIVHYTEIVPGSSCLITQQPTTPAVFVLTEKSDAAIELEGQKITSPCSN